MVNAVIYARYSSHAQREESIESQLRRCHEYAEQKGFSVIAEYCDRAISGKTDNRTEFQRMIKASEKGQFQAIIMYTLDRFARNRYDSAMYKAKLKKNGVRIYYTEQSISDEPEGIILEAVLEGMAEYYSENLSRGVKRGMNENALKCLVNGGTMTLGYRKSKNNKYEIDPSKAYIVEEAFNLAYAEKKTDREIMNIFNERGYRTSKGKPFTLSSISKMLTNSKYKGDYVFGDVTIKGGVPAIVSEAVFEDVQANRKLNKRRSGRMKAPELYMLTGKLYCGHCGAAMRGESGTSQTGAIYNYYKCATRKTQRVCNKANEKKDWIEQAVVEETIRRVLQPNAIDEIATAVAELAEKEYNDTSRLSTLQGELKGVQSAIGNLLRLVEQGINTDDIGDRLLDLNSQKADIQKQITREETKRPALTKDKIVFWLTKFIANGDMNDKEYMQRVVDTLVHRVYVFDEDGGHRKLVITYNVSSNPQSTITLSDINKSSDIISYGSPKKSPFCRTGIFLTKSVLSDGRNPTSWDAIASR